MQLSEAISQRLSKKGSFAAADGIKPRAPPPKPRRTFEKLPETAQESIKMPPESASPHKPSVTVTSPAHQGSKTPPITYPLIQNRPLPSVPQVDGDSPYVCDITLNLSKCKHTNQLPPTHPPPPCQVICIYPYVLLPQLHFLGQRGFSHFFLLKFRN